MNEWAIREFPVFCPRAVSWAKNARTNERTNATKTNTREKYILTTNARNMTMIKATKYKQDNMHARLSRGTRRIVITVL
eukprot:9856360-Lingulodinium_polyedra.AAC.1